MSDLTRRTAAELAEALSIGETSSVELTEAHLDRIGRVDGHVHAGRDVGDGDQPARRDALHRDGPARRHADRGAGALDGLYAAAVDLLGPRPKTWDSLVDEDPARDLQRSRSQIESLRGSDRSEAQARLHESAVRSRSLLPATRAMGCCGTLGTVIH